MHSVDPNAHLMMTKVLSKPDFLLTYHNCLGRPFGYPSYVRGANLSVIFPPKKVIDLGKRSVSCFSTRRHYIPCEKIL